MPTRARVCAWIAIFVLAPPAPAPAQDRTEREIVELIVRDGPEAAAIRARLEVTRREQIARLAPLNPAVTYTREGAGFTEFLQAEQSLPVFGTRAAISRAGLAASEAAEAGRDALLWALRSAGAGAAVRVLAGQARLEVTAAHAREVQRLIEILRTREREGESSRFDRLRAELELGEARRLATAAAAALAEARAALASMLPGGLTVTRVSGAVDPRPAAAPAAALMERAVSARGELRALRQAARHAALEAAAARRARLPAPTLVGGIKRADEAAGPQHGAVFGVSATIPLFDAGGRDAARWAAERARVDAELALAESRIRGEIAGAFEVLAVRLAALHDPQEEPAGELVQIAEVAYREGEVGILELLDAVRTASQARLRRVDLWLDARLAQIALERAVGDVLWP